MEPWGWKGGNGRNGRQGLKMRAEHVHAGRPRVTTSEGALLVSAAATRQPAGAQAALALGPRRRTLEASEPACRPRASRAAPSTARRAARAADRSRT